MYTKERGFHFGAYENIYGIRDGQFMREYHRAQVRTNYTRRKPLFGSTPAGPVQWWNRDDSIQR